MKKFTLSLLALMLLTSMSIAQQNSQTQSTTAKKASKKGDKKSMTSKHDPSMSKRTEIKNPPTTK